MLAAPLERLSLATADAEVLRCFTLSNLANLRTLELKSVLFTNNSAWVSAFANLKQLTSLHIKDAIIDMDNDNEWSLPVVESLNCETISEARFFAPRLLRFEGGFSVRTARSLLRSPALQTIIVRHCMGHNEKEVIDILCSGSWPALVHFEDDEELKTASLLRLVEQFTALRFLACTINSAEKVPDIVHQIMARRPAVHTCKVTQNDIGDFFSELKPPVVARLPVSPACSELVSLELGPCNDEALSQLRCPKLQTLTLVGTRCNVSQLGASPSVCFPVLQSLELRLFPLDRQRTCAFVASCSALQDFHLSTFGWHKIDLNEFLCQLAKVKHATLRTITLNAKSTTEVEPEAIVRLIRNTPNLTTLRFTDSANVSDAVRVALQTPACRARASTGLRVIVRDAKAFTKLTQNDDEESDG